MAVDPSAGADENRVRGDYRSCPGSHTVGLGRARGFVTDETEFRQTVARRAGRATGNRPPTIRSYFMLIKILLTTTLIIITSVMHRDETLPEDRAKAKAAKRGTIKVSKLELKTSHMNKSLVR